MDDGRKRPSPLIRPVSLAALSRSFTARANETRAAFLLPRRERMIVFMKLTDWYFHRGALEDGFQFSADMCRFEKFKFHTPGMRQTGRMAAQAARISTKLTITVATAGTAQRSPSPRNRCISGIFCDLRARICAATYFSMNNSSVHMRGLHRLLPGDHRCSAGGR